MPGNDDAARAIQTYCDLVADAVLDGLAAGAGAAGIDLGAAVNPEEPMLREAKTAAAEAEAVAEVADEAAAELEAVAEEIEAAESEKAEG